MNKKGFLLLEVLMGLFLFGIVTTTCLPILNTSLNNLRLTKNKMDMLFIAESTIEQIKSFDYNLYNEDEYLFDMKLIDLINILKEEDLVTIVLPMDMKDNSSSYICTIYKENNCNNLWKILAEVSPFEDENKIHNIKVVTIMPIPKE